MLTTLRAHSRSDLDGPQELKTKATGDLLPRDRAAPHLLHRRAFFRAAAGLVIPPPQRCSAHVRYPKSYPSGDKDLPAGDDVRKTTVKAIAAGLKAFTAVADAVDSARTAESLASTKIAKAIDAWEKQMEKTYGALVSELGRAAAERFFPRAPRRGAAGSKTEKGDKKPE
jgi:hypothetical protein